MVAQNSGEVSNNKVQATDNGKRRGINASLIVGIGNSSTTYKTYSGDSEGNNIVERYVMRDPTDDYKNEIDLNEYYGDMIKFSGTSIIESEVFIL